MTEAKCERVFVGVDGGGTKTKLIAINSQNEVISEITTNSTNKNSVGLENAKNTLISALKLLFEQISEKMISKYSIDAMWFGLAGLDRKLTREWVTSEFPNVQKIFISTDVEVALASGTDGDLRGTVIIAGTGTISMAFMPPHPVVRASGWGYVVFSFQK